MKIGFIAMSGIRVFDQELFEIGLTLPGVLERGKVIAALPSLGLLTLAGMTPKEHDCHYMEIFDLRAEDAIPDGLEDFDLIAISSYSAQIFEAYELADTLREKGVTEKRNSGETGSRSKNLSCARRCSRSSASTRISAARPSLAPHIF